MTVTLVCNAEVPARREGKCDLCAGPIRKGEYITKHKTCGWVHAGCAADLHRTMEKLDEEFGDA